jgi:epoxide hydrolase-like predicted phosphatase
MLEAIRRLRVNGFKVGVITNNWTEEESGKNGEKSQTQSSTTSSSPHPLLGLVDVLVESRLERIRKPDERIYRLCCQRIGVEAKCCVFLDDIGRNLKPAKELGMRTIKVESTQQALRDLEGLIGINLCSSRTSPSAKL